MINMVTALVEKMESAHEEMGSFSRERDGNDKKESNRMPNK